MQWENRIFQTFLTTTNRVIIGLEMRKINDKLTVEMFQKMPVVEQVRLLNARLRHYYQQDNNQRDLRFVEKYILNDIRFLREVQSIREELGISQILEFEIYASDPSIVRDWLVHQVSGKHLDWNDSAYKANDQKITNMIARLLERFALPNGWFGYIEAYLAVDALPIHTEVERDTIISVDNIEPNEVIIRMERGLKPEDYATAWKALKPFFKQPSINVPTADTVKDRIYLDRKRGLGISDIAKTYYAAEYASDAAAARDKVKKILARHKD